MNKGRIATIVLTTLFSAFAFAQKDGSSQNSKIDWAAFEKTISKEIALAVVATDCSSQATRFGAEMAESVRQHAGIVPNGKYDQTLTARLEQTASFYTGMCARAIQRASNEGVTQQEIHSALNRSANRNSQNPSASSIPLESNLPASGFDPELFKERLQRSLLLSAVAASCGEQGQKFSADMTSSVRQLAELVPNGSNNQALNSQTETAAGVFQGMCARATQRALAAGITQVEIYTALSNAVAESLLWD